MKRINRRGFLRNTVGSVAALSLPAGLWPAGEARAASEGILRRRLGEGLYLLQGGGANVVVKQAGDELLVINGGLAEHAEAVLDAISEVAGDMPITTLINTCWHDEHVGLNAVVGEQGGRIIAHQNTRGWMGASFHSRWSGRSHEAHPAHALPNDTFRTTGGRLTVGGELELAGERVEYGHVPQAHTDGDLYVHFLDSDVLVLGEVLSVGRYPLLDYHTGGYIAGLLQATHDMLERVGADTQVVPGSAPAQRRDALQRQYEMLGVVYTRLVRWKDDGMSAADMVANGISEEFDAEWGEPDRFVDSAYWSMWGRIREFETIV